MNYYTYTIYFVDGYYYHGYHKHEGVDPLTDGYFGSPVTHKEKWLTTMHWKEITGLHETVEDVRFAEQESIRPVFKTDPYCLNENCGGAMSPEVCQAAGRIGGRRTNERRDEQGRSIQGVINAQTLNKDKDEEGRSVNAVKGALILNGRMHEEKTPDGKSKHAVKMGKAAHSELNEDGKSVLGTRAAKKLNAEKTEDGKSKYAVEAGKIGGKRGSAITNSQKWKCLVTGYVTTAGPLTKYQRAKGIDTSLRTRVG
jgi:hypothetical protein